MSDFNILILRDFLTDSDFKIILEAFSNLYYNITPKHQRRMQLDIVAESDNHQMIQELGQKLEISKKINIVDSQEINEVEVLYKRASVLVMPVNEEVAYTIAEIMVCGIPVLCYETPTIKTYLDHTCAMMVKNRSNSALKEIRMVEVFSEKIEMLYFDPEVQKLLKKGAEVLYNRKLDQSRTTVSSEKTSIFNYFKHPIQSLLNKRASISIPSASQAVLGGR